MKPRIWKQNGMWLCSYYRSTLTNVAGRGFTPYLAWYMWKYRITDAS